MCTHIHVQDMTICRSFMTTISVHAAEKIWIQKIFTPEFTDISMCSLLSNIITPFFGQ